MTVGRTLGTLASLVALVGCSPIGPPVRVITGVDEDHVLMTEPLREIIPSGGEDDAQLTLDFDVDRALLGLEGGVLFLRARSPGGTVVLDRVVDEADARQTLAAGLYTLDAYYRSCDGNCSLLDPAESMCSADGELMARERYRLSVSRVHGALSDAAFTCEMTAL